MIAEATRRRSSVRAEPPKLGELTGREREVLERIARGLSNAEITARIYLAEQTVKTQVGRVFAKLRPRDRARAVVFAYGAAVVAPGS
jgi:DNA-binding NarL/FixJ family response regulator